MKGAAAYRLQVLETGGRVAASMLVKGTEASLSDFVLAQLQAPATYQWRVSALNTNGDVIASSAPRTIKVKGR